ncbi:MAG: UDP-N-acetylmuramate dehydrogenase [Clostridia bacterium]
MKKITQLLDKQGISYLENEPMKKHTTFKTGGNAKIFIEPTSENQLKTILEICSQNDAKTFVFGNGSNLLVSDDGIDAVVIHIGKQMSEIELLDDFTIKVEAGASLVSLCKFALDENLSGMEFAYGIPASVGGAAFMNAGAYGEQMQDVVFMCNHVDSHGKSGSFLADELQYDYRKSAYNNTDLIVTSVIVKLKRGDSASIEAKMRELIFKRKDKQPLEYPSAGSVFKRPEGHFAGALIEQSGLKGKSVGGAMVSEKHAGFIINFDNATTTDVLDLIEICKKEVKEKFDVNLETEIKMV